MRRAASRGEPAPAPLPPLGAHVRVGQGLVRGALAQAAEIGATAIQVFLGNPRGWAESPGDPADDREFRARVAAAGLPVFVHAAYLVNVGSPDPLTARRSFAALAHSLRRAAAVGARGVVVHTGSCVTDGQFEPALRRIAAGLAPLLAGLAAGDPDLLLEPTAGQGRSLAASVPDLRAYLAALDHHPRLGVCLDTCHVFAAGAPLDTAGGPSRLLDQLADVAGPGRLRLIHANDSRDPRGSNRDRHERIGRGRIGAAAFAELLAHPLARGVPVVLETPGGVAAYREDLALLRSLLGHG